MGVFRLVHGVGMEKDDEIYNKLYKTIKDPSIDDIERKHALDELLADGRDKAEEMLISLANDGYLKFELRNVALEYCFKFKKGECTNKGDNKE